MECPNCNENQAIVLHTDPITCEDCKSVMTIEYCACMGCNYSFRLSNGKFIDGADLENGNIAEALAEISEEHSDAIYNLSVGAMSELIHHCLKCGAPAAYEKNEYMYACGACGFEWEILSHE